MSLFINIAIDGPSASGKGTIARRLADHFHLSYLDTGALYRAVGKHILDQGKNPDSPDDAVASALYVRDHLSWEMLEDQALRNDVVADATSRSSRIPEVREILKDTQRQFAVHPPHKPKLKPWAGSILDGRDIGTVVCPDATIKFFITASPEVRAKRRAKELISRGVNTTYEAVLLDMLDRDARDQNRTVAPAKAAEDAIILDTSDLSADEVYEKARDLVCAKLA